MSCQRPTTMASLNPFLCLLPLLATLLVTVFTYNVSAQSKIMYPFACSHRIHVCNASLYRTNTGLSTEQIASFYSVNSSQIKPIIYRSREDHLITVPCSCQNVNGTTGYFYDTSYLVNFGDTFTEVSQDIYNGQAWVVGDEDRSFTPGNKVIVHLLCGCVEIDSQTVVTYTVQENDILVDIATLLASTVKEIQKLNVNLTQNPSFIQPGWVLYVPMEKDGLPPSDGSTENNSSGKRTHKSIVIVAILSAVTIFLLAAIIAVLLSRKRSRENDEKDPKAVIRSLTTTRASSLKGLYIENMKDATAFESERPVIYNLEEIEEATSNFDETKKIGVGGYGSVYFGVLGETEVAIKKMWSNKSKEFFAELKVLCKIHHINVVELLGFASGDDHLYLVYEFVENGSLNEHLHDPLLKGHQPLSWPARAQIALDAAKGIEYIHDQTKARYVHRDIKTSNILLDNKLRAKVADFGLAKLVERSDEDELIATRLVGTPGYLPPESVKVLQVTSKTDVFAFGVVLAELITGKRALVRDSNEPNRMKSLITVMYRIFEDDDPEAALLAVVDRNLQASYPFEDVYKMAEIANWCLSETAIARPEMRDIVPTLTQIKISSIEWEASLGGNSQVFSGIFHGR